MRRNGLFSILGLSLLSLAGCQCCALTEHYACAVDRISDHEHHYERFYSPACDLNRIGRPDWCSYPLHHLICGCVCDRCKPAPCGFVVCRESTIIRPATMDATSSPSDDAGEPAPQEADAPPPPAASLDAPIDGDALPADAVESLYPTPPPPKPTEPPDAE